MSKSVLDLSGVGLGYTLATGRLFCAVSEFHRFAEELDGGPILTHEFGDEATWQRLREKYEARVLAGSSLSEEEA